MGIAKPEAQQASLEPCVEPLRKYHGYLQSAAHCGLDEIDDAVKRCSQTSQISVHLFWERQRTPQLLSWHSQVLDGCVGY